MIAVGALKIGRVVPDERLIEHPAFIERGRVVYRSGKAFFEQFFALKLKVAADKVSVAKIPGNKGLEATITATLPEPTADDYAVQSFGAQFSEVHVDPDTGDLWIGDVGQNRIEEIDRLVADGDRPAGYGANLGWDLFEGTERFESPDPAPGPASEGPFVTPILTYSHDEGGCSVTGGVVVRDPRLAGLDGAFLYSDFCAGGVRAVRPSWITPH